MKTSREQFEEWFADNMFIGNKCIADAATKRRMLRAWQASRQCIEVALPDWFYDMHKDKCLDYKAVTDALSSAGIKIKGA